jgi:hypothetical protein
MAYVSGRRPSWVAALTSKTASPRAPRSGPQRDRRARAPPGRRPCSGRRCAVGRAEPRRRPRARTRSRRGRTAGRGRARGSQQSTTWTSAAQALDVPEEVQARARGPRSPPGMSPGTSATVNRVSPAFDDGRGWARAS